MASDLMKEGTKVFQGLEATLKNIEAVKELSKITRTSLGPNGIIIIYVFLRIIKSEVLKTASLGLFFIVNLSSRHCPLSFLISAFLWPLYHLPFLYFIKYILFYLIPLSDRIYIFRGNCFLFRAEANTFGAFPHCHNSGFLPNLYLYFIF